MLTSEQKGELLERWASIAEVKPRQTPDQWAAASRTYPKTAGVPGPRDPNMTPYMVPWARALSSGDWAAAVMVSGAQMGKTDTELDVIGERLDNRPAPVIYVGPSKEFCTDQFEPRFMAMLDEAPALAHKVARGRVMKKTRKLVAGVPIRLAHAGSSTALKSDPAALALVDEYDEMMANVKGQGDPLGLVKARGHTYADFVWGAASTPSVGSVDVDSDGFWKMALPEDLESPIWTLWQEGTRQHWCWPCPHCDEYFVPRFSCLKWEGETPADAGRTAHVVCPKCGGVIEQRDKTDLNAGGVYLSPGQKVVKGEVRGNLPDTRVASFWVSGLCSPFVTLGAAAEEYATQAHIRDLNKIQTCINAKFGELFSPKFGLDAPKWQTVADHRSPYYKGDLPDGVIHVVTTVDVQKHRLIYCTRGWGARSTSWLLDWGEFFGETEHDEVWASLADYITHNVCGRPIKLVLIDSGFRPGKRDAGPLNRVYDFARRFPRFVRCTKGSSHAMQVPLKVNHNFEVTERGSGRKFGLEIMRLDTDFFKSWVHERLHWPGNELGSWYLPEDIDDDYMRQIIAESRTRLPSGRVLWVEHSSQNHFLDCEAMQAAAAHLLNTARLAPEAKARTPRAPVSAVVASRQPGRQSLASRLAR